MIFLCPCFYFSFLLKTLKRVFPLTRPMRGVIGEGGRWGGPQRGGPSWRSWQRVCLLCKCIHPALPTRSKVNDWEIKRPTILDSASGEGMAVIGQRCAQEKPSKEHHTDQSHRRRPMRHRTSPRNQPGSRREPRDQHGEQDMQNARARTQGKKKNSREAKRRSASAEKNKSKRISMEK